MGQSKNYSAHFHALCRTYARGLVVVVQLSRIARDEYSNNNHSVRLGHLTYTMVALATLLLLLSHKESRFN